MVRNGTTNLEITIWVEDMTRKTNTALIALLGTILMGLSTWVLITLIELQTIVAEIIFPNFFSFSNFKALINSLLKRRT